MITNTKRIFMILSLMIMAAMACNFSSTVNPAPTPLVPAETKAADPINSDTAQEDTLQATANAEEIAINVALTVAAQSTLSVGETAVANLTQIAAQPSATSPLPTTTQLPPTATAAEQPPTETAPPPPPPSMSADGSKANGNCSCDTEDCNIKIGPSSGNDIFGSFVQFQVFKDGEELTGENGVTHIEFRVMRSNVGPGEEPDYGDFCADCQQVYSTIESTAAYCLFGGNGPCFSWPLVGDTYGFSNTPVRDGEWYYIEALPEIPGCDVYWGDYFQISLP